MALLSTGRRGSPAALGRFPVSLPSRPSGISKNLLVAGAGPFARARHYRHLLHLSNCRQQARAFAEIRCLEQGLLLARIEGADHRNRADEPLARYRGDRIPIGRDLVLLKIGPEPAHQPLAIKLGHLLSLDISGKLLPIRDDAAIAL